MILDFQVMSVKFEQITHFLHVAHHQMNKLFTKENT